MSVASRWDRCIKHRGSAAEQFLAKFLCDKGRNVLLVCGGGFDPRSCIVSRQLAGTCQGRLAGLIIREERTQSTSELRELADKHVHELTQLIDQPENETIAVFADDGAVTGGRSAIAAIGKHNVTRFTDIVVDFSALSIGVAFPLIRYLLNAVDALANKTTINLHLVAIDEPWTDGLIESVASDRVAPILGFNGRWGLEEAKGSARLWLPQLGVGQSIHDILRRALRFIDPHAVCPILPFSEANPRFSDQLMQEFQGEFASDGPWKIDSPDIVYARENDPLDLYRTILRIEIARRRAFADVGGSLTILSPLGRKMLAIGILMAALDRDFPVVHVEAVGFHVDVAEMTRCRAGRAGDLCHIWLAGEPYPQESSMEASTI